jgi:NAD(P)H-hydrate repair Nnr-like enzyme with NAD(P)H-hydrate dehydratase domain
MIAGREAARTAALRAAEARDGGVKGDGGLVIVIGGSRAYAAPPYLAGLAARRAGHRREQLLGHGTQGTHLVRIESVHHWVGPESDASMRCRQRPFRRERLPGTGRAAATSVPRGNRKPQGAASSD